MKNREKIQALLSVIVIILIAYLLSASFRNSLSINKIEPEFLTGALTAAAILIGLIEASKDRAHSVALEMAQFVREKGLTVIGKLISVRNKAAIYRGTLSAIKNALLTNQVFVDSNNFLSKDDLEREMEFSAAYIEALFPDQKENWNLLLEKLSALGTLCSNIFLRYEDQKKTGSVPISFIASINELEAQELLNEIESIALEVRDSVVRSINKKHEILV